MDPETAAFAVRILNGPLKDCVYPGDDRLEIGRGEGADIQLAGRGVSRQHASIIASEEGFVLVDMLSTNGTWHAGSRVSKHSLRDGDRFVIDDCEFEFQIPDKDDAPDDDEPPSESPTTPPTKAPTKPPTKPRISRVRMTRETVDFEGPRLRSSEGGPGPGRRAAGSDENHRFVAPGGSRYAKDLLADIMLYRNLRLRVLRRGGEAKTETLRAFRALDGDLRYAPPGQTDSSERREFTRFSCHIPGTLRFERGAETRHDVRMVDVAVDGARIRCSTVPAETTGLVYLSLPTVGPAGLRCIVFTARVAWVRGTELGLVFAGAPSWATRNKERAEDDTLRRPIPPLHLEEKDSE